MQPLGKGDSHSCMSGPSASTLGVGAPSSARKSGSRKGTHRRSRSCSLGWRTGRGLLYTAIQNSTPFRDTFRDGGTMFRRRRTRNPGNPTPAQQSLVLLRYPNSRGRCVPIPGGGLITSRRRMKYSPARYLANLLSTAEGGSRPEAGVGGGQPAGGRSDHVLSACLRLSLHLRAAGKQEPPEVSHPARPHPRSLGGSFLPPPSSTRQRGVLAGQWRCSTDY